MGESWSTRENPMQEQGNMQTHWKVQADHQIQTQDPPADPSPAPGVHVKKPKR